MAEKEAPSGFRGMLDKHFKLTERKSTILTEFRAGTATFLTLCYILSVNASLLSNSGGPCPDSREVVYKGNITQCDVAAATTAGQPSPANFFNDPTGCYHECVGDVKKALITTTAVSSFLATLTMGVTANLPFAMAPGMGLNAYFTYDVVGFMGGGSHKWQTAITAVFIEGIIFMLLAITGLRVKFAKAIPNCIKLATTAGIGMFLAHIGLQTAEGIGLVVADIATAVTLGGCKPSNRNPAYFCEPGFGPPTHGPVPVYQEDDKTYPDGISPFSWTDYMFPFDQRLRGCAPAYYEDSTGNFSPETCPPGMDPGTAVHAICLSEPGVYTCDTYGGRMESPTMWIGIVGFVIMSILLVKKYKAAIIVGVAFVTVISWFRGTDVSYFEDDVWAGGAERFEYFKKIAKVEPVGIVAGKLDFDGFSDGSLWSAIFTFLYVDLLDTTATLFAMAKFANLLDENGNFEGQEIAFIVDGFYTSIGALLGSSPVTTYIESAPGIEEGGRTGLTAVFVSMYFFLCIFFAPILASIPPWATGPALVIVGAMMMKGIVKVDWDDYSQAIPAFVTIIVMPLTYSIAYGIIGGILSYLIINGSVYMMELAMGQATWPPPYIVDLMADQPAGTTVKGTPVIEDTTSVEVKATADVAL
mmetsp:Transcript_28278/g.34339  ORF Transcript_28278/g.34339 Transcript_28278/m.34339 type:complete len:642 (+) Transcript_28278:171-2096(+)|eukprot:CAMPEP_0197859130 /NCGR_PEP_ID=MMETSP1438-20131217/33500_1 /TAXON_ID=1461541 /ORGANISM="Pterosperma sp., Strain CCMP1384" /LENGTH=641 /DNA_ID=CAMNT_0043475537 /DNA_START=129 /DNA_END=2054 /DNA_ORIENTATION=-